MSFRFVAFDEEVTKELFISVDGVTSPRHPNETFNLTHWIGNTAPEDLKASTTIEMALKLIRLPNWRDRLGAAQILTNNHFDTDGVVACWILMEPDKVAPYADLLIASGMAGDHGVFSTPEGVKLDLLFTNLEDFERSPIAEHLSPVYKERSQYMYDWTLDNLPRLLDEIDAYPQLWEPEYKAIVDGLHYVASGGATIREHEEAVLAVVESDRWLHPMARRSRAQGGRLLTIVPQAGGHLIELEYTLWTFHDMPDRVPIQRPALDHMVTYFNQIETANGGEWVFDTSYAPVPKLHYVNKQDELIPSQLNPQMVEHYLLDYFIALGDRWPYYEEWPWGSVVDGEIVPVVTIWEL